jgi:hypothetical protein
LSLLDIFWLCSLRCILCWPVFLCHRHRLTCEIEMATLTTII